MITISTTKKAFLFLIPKSSSWDIQNKISQDKILLGQKIRNLIWFSETQTLVSGNRPRDIETWLELMVLCEWISIKTDLEKGKSSQFGEGRLKIGKNLLRTAWKGRGKVKEILRLEKVFDTCGNGEWLPTIFGHLWRVQFSYFDSEFLR